MWTIPLCAGAAEFAILSAQEPDDVFRAYNGALKARQAYPQDREITKALGILSYRLEYYQWSVDLLKEAEGQLQDDPVLLHYLGIAHRQLKQWAECKDALDRGLKLKLPERLLTEAISARKACAESIG